ncbi:MAG: bifunctional riboflavin kinase/FAD synthetase, partial [Clostridia bacterium]|nr:bifunctional riboflavin kinase/FAD synthetase [Clostridia bacterium]
MDIIYATADKVYNNTLIMLGNFDGIHLAHMSVINRGIQYAKENSLKSTLFMFENHTRNEKLITPNKIKLKILSDIAPDFLYIEKFDDNIMKKSPEEFIQMLIKKLGMRAVCIGYDYRFGHKAQGDVKTMYSLGKKYGFDVLVTEKVSIDNITVSSSHIRTLIENGDIKKASEFIGRPFTMCGVVE